LKFLLLFGGSVVCSIALRVPRIRRGTIYEHFIRKAKQQTTLTCSTWARRDGNESMLRLLKK
jgi:hypothetical protein